MSLRVRILPLTIMAVGMSLAIKMADVVRGGEEFAQTFLVASVSAQSGGEAPPSPPVPPAEAVQQAVKDATPVAPAASEEKAGEEKKESAEEEAPDPESIETPEEGEEMGLRDSSIAGKAGEANKKGIKLVDRLPAVDPTKGGPTDVPPSKDSTGAGAGLAPGARYFSPIELEILETLSKRRDALEEWDRNIEIKENLLSSVEKRVDEKLAQVEKLQVDLKDLISSYSQQEDAKIKSLVKIYETMKPRDAARIFDEVEMPILLLVIDKMAEKKAAPILASMDPKKAKQLTVELAEQRRLTSNKLSGQQMPQAAPPNVTVPLKN
jgi:flagellar motility protein MotE (MotC chaperone)